MTTPRETPLKTKLITIAFIIFLAGVILIANAGLQSRFFGFIRQVPGRDKTGHFVLMGILAFLMNLCFKGETFRGLRVPVLKGSFIVLVAVTLEELTQIFMASRAFDLADLAADYLGILLFGRLAWLICKRGRRVPG